MDSRERMYFQCAPIHIEAAIKILRQIKKDYGEIPLAVYGGGGIHIEVLKCDKPLNELSTTFSCRHKTRKIRNGVRRHYLKKNPTTHYVWIW